MHNDTAEDGAYEYFQMGRVCYELNEIDEAIKYFEIAYQEGKNGRSKSLIKNIGNFIQKIKNKPLQTCIPRRMPLLYYLTIL